MNLNEIKTYELKIKKEILNKYKDSKKYFTVQDVCNEINISPDQNIYKQLVKNVLSQLYKSDEAIRIKKGLYTFSDDIYRMREKVEDISIKDKLVLSDIYYDYLCEKTQAIPSFYNIYVDSSVFNDFSVESVNIFFDHYGKAIKKVKLLNKFNSKELLLIKIIIYLNDSCIELDNDLEKYIIKKMEQLNINMNDVISLTTNLYFKKSFNFIKQKTKKEFNKRMKRILNG